MGLARKTLGEQLNASYYTAETGGAPRGTLGLLAQGIRTLTKPEETMRTAMGSAVQAIAPNPDIMPAQPMAMAGINNPNIIQGAAAQQAGGIQNGGKKRQVGTGISSQLGINV